MKTFEFKPDGSSVLRVHGALDFDTRADGLGVRRLPSWTRPQIPQGLDVMARMPSGVRIQLQTSASQIHLSTLTTTMRSLDGKAIDVPFQLEFENELHTSYASNGNWIKVDPTNPMGYELIRGNHDTIKFEDLPRRAKFCEIWLPHNAFVSLRSISIDDQGELLPLPEERRPHWVHYGSSISHCMEANLPTETWPAVAARLANVSLTSFGFGGQCHLDQFVARTIRDTRADLITMKIGINVINLNSMKERVFIPAVHGMIDTIREKQPDTPIALISPIYCPSAETRAGPTIPDEKGQFQTEERASPFNGSLTLQRVREILKEVVETRTQYGDDRIDYFNGLELLSETEGDDLPDSLHPSPSAYIRMGERFSAKYLQPKFK